ncbi:MAG: 5'-methylthioadenosine/adenosylhomocysteine nucleosidase [Spirochaetia bacterium]|nr:5'-methylthioadenosine/adenosylhomocysteine nucleosidase [Spirochaetia bacterium]
MYAILTALESESKCFIEKMDTRIIDKWNNYKFVIGTFAGQECVIGHTGIGKVNSAVVVGYIIEKYNPSIVFYTGIAGALKTDLNIGDVVLAGDSVQWDVDITFFGFKIGELPEVSFNSVEKSNSRFFKTDSELLEKALKWNPGGFKVVQGRIITGDSFFTQTLQSDKADLIKKLGAYAVDMEGAAAGAAAGMYGIPFFLARVISDTSSGKKPRSFKSFMKVSSCKMTNLIEYLLTDFS